jgi:hypothetical protein
MRGAIKVWLSDSLFTSCSLIIAILKSALSEDRIMLPDQFSDRLDIVRKRFASSLESKIKDMNAELPNFSDGCVNAVDAVANAYRRIHGICGVGGTVGFAATGRAAKDVEEVLIGAYRDHRGLAAAEISRLEKMLGALAVVAQAELNSNRGFSASKDEK